MQRKLTAILSADLVGYSGLMEADEVGTLERLKANRSRIFDPQVAAHGGRIFKLMGDGALAEFASIVSAVSCAIAIQNAMSKSEPELEADQRLRYRIGVNLGDVLVEGDDIYGDGVNVASRLQGLAPVGGVALSRTVRDNIEGKLPCAFDDLGEHLVKGMRTPVQVFLVRMGPSGADAAMSAQHVRAKPCICVLPFLNMSDDPQQEYFSDGITEDLITDLSKVSAVTVIARNSAFSFKGGGADPQKLARQLRASHILEGSVRKAGARVRITAQLIDASRSESIWAERYDRELTDIFTLQDEISQTIVAALKLSLLPEEKRAIQQRGTTSLEAYDLYQMARQLYLGGRFTTFFDLNSLIDLCKSAIAADPNYALAWAHLGLSQAVQFTTGRLACDDGRQAAERAVALDAALADGHMAMARVLLNEEKFEEARGEISIALGLVPESADARWIAALILRSQNKYAQAIAHLQYVVDQYPDGLVPAGMLMMTCLDQGDELSAGNAARRVAPIAHRTLQEHPAYGTAMGYLAIALAIFGEAERAREMVREGLTVDPGNSTMKILLVSALGELRDIDSAFELFSDLLGAANSTQIHYFRRVAHAVLRADPRFATALAAAEKRLATAPR
jgi:adenylate cyclase